MVTNMRLFKIFHISNLINCIKYLKELNFSKPWLLAGGISIDWLKQILIDIKPDGIDVSSSIESAPGIKDLNKTKKLLNIIKG